MPTVPTYHLALFVCLCYLTLLIAVRNVPPESDDINLAVIDHAVICKPPIPPLASLNDCTRAVQLPNDGHTCCIGSRRRLPVWRMSYSSRPYVEI